MAATCVKPLPLYHRRDPQASDLSRLIDEHFETFAQIYDERFQAKYGYWRPVEGVEQVRCRKAAGLQELERRRVLLQSLTLKGDHLFEQDFIIGLGIEGSGGVDSTLKIVLEDRFVAFGAYR